MAGEIPCQYVPPFDLVVCTVCRLEVLVTFVKILVVLADSFRDEHIETEQDSQRNEINGFFGENRRSSLGAK
jgi:hypothetical protein